MREEERATLVNPPAGETSADARPTLGAPNFDARSVRHARPAVPLTRGAERRSTLTWAAVALVAGMVGGLLGIFALNSYQSRGTAGRAGEAAEGGRAAVSHEAPAQGGADGVAPTPGDSAAGADGTEGAATGDETAAAGAADGAGQTPVGAEEAAQLRGALAGWLAATNARDLEGQMKFYDSRVGVFYLSRNASRAAVRAEKSHVFARAAAVDVRAGEPQITLSRDGQTATMRFRKQYAIGGADGEQRRGAVLQELRWRRTPAGWKIIGERDLKVIE